MRVGCSWGKWCLHVVSLLSTSSREHPRRWGARTPLVTREQVRGDRVSAGLVLPAHRWNTSAVPVIRKLNAVHTAAIPLSAALGAGLPRARDTRNVPEDM